MHGPLPPRHATPRRMLRPTDQLRAEHEVVAQALDVLSAIAASIERGAAFPADDAATVLRFLREFVVAVHLRKESEHVGPALVMAGDERTAGLVGDWMRLHGEVIDLLHALVLFWEPSSELTRAERTGFAETAAAFRARVQRMHQLEERELFPACDASIPADDQLGFCERFAELERERGGVAEWRARVRALARTWLG